MHEDHRGMEMTRKRIVLILLPCVLLGLVLFSIWALSPGSDKGEADRNTQTVAARDPVSEPVGQQEYPGTEDDWGEEERVVEIPFAKQQLIGVRTFEVVRAPLLKTIRTVGIVEYDERRLATVNTKFEGWIEKLFVDYSGRYVRKGEPLAEIYSPELFATQQEFISLTRWAKKYQGAHGNAIGELLAGDAESVVMAAKQRLQLWDISEEQIEKIERTGVPVRTLTIYSPVSGYVIQKKVLRGMRVGPGDTLFDIADLSSVWIVSDIFEYELPMVKVGQKATIMLSYFPEKEFTSRIDYIYPTVSGDTRSAKVRFVLPNPGGRLKPQMYTNVTVRMDLGKKLAVPPDAVIDTGTTQIVYVDKGEGYFEPREIGTGMKTDTLVEVLRGLTEGERVATSANFLIDSEAKLKGVVRE
jgi:Cu(I)/Ag(I) efflux system membrane fusion protein